MCSGILNRNSTDFIYSSNTTQRIHPASEENVRETREEVNQQRANHPHNNPGTHQQTSRENSNTPVTENHGQHQCPICLGTAEYAIQTNCGHVFCGNFSRILVWLYFLL